MCLQEKKKSDKVVYDSEERAFWRTRRPGQANCLEQHIQVTLLSKNLEKLIELESITLNLA